MNNWRICWFFAHIFTGDLNFKALTARRRYKSFGVRGLSKNANNSTVILDNLRVAAILTVMSQLKLAHTTNYAFVWLSE
jgi:hypothetical protein